MKTSSTLNRALLILALVAAGAAGSVAQPVRAETPASVPPAPSSFTNSRLSMLMGCPLSGALRRAYRFCFEKKSAMASSCASE